MSRKALKYGGGVFRDCPIYASSGRSSHTCPLERRQRPIGLRHNFFHVRCFAKHCWPHVTSLGCYDFKQVLKRGHSQLKNLYIRSLPACMHRTTHFPIMGLAPTFRIIINSWMKKTERSSLKHISVPIVTTMCHVVIFQAHPKEALRGM